MHQIILVNVFRGDRIGVVLVRLTGQFSNVRGVVIRCVVLIAMLFATGLHLVSCPTMRVCAMCVCVPTVCDIPLRRGRERTRLYQARTPRSICPRVDKLSRRWSRTGN